MPDVPLWTLDEILDATEGTLEGEPPVASFGGVSIDSRTVSPGDVYVAIRGERLDGHDFAANALKAGAALAIVSRADDAMRKEGALLVVEDDPLDALCNLAVASRDRSAARIIAVTGSVGKTTTKEALALALAPSGRTHASVASFNNHWGVPLTLARMPREAAFGVFEVGMNHAGEITPLSRMVRPHVAVITAVAESHLGAFSSLAEIAEAKAEIFAGMEPGGAGVINADSEFFARLAERAQAAGVEVIVGFGSSPPARVRLLAVEPEASGSLITADLGGRTLTYRLGMSGRHAAMNSLAVLATAALVDADVDAAAEALAGLSAPKGRGVRHVLALDGGAVTLIDESYNANPASMRAALALLREARPGNGGRRIAVLGDMLELGSHAPELHAGLAQPIDEAGADAVYACGPNMAHLWERLPEFRRARYEATSDALVEPLLGTLRPGDVVMVKGSLGSRMGPVVEAVLRTFRTNAEAS